MIAFELSYDKVMISKLMPCHKIILGHIISYDKS